mgnify:CR=1 FL=1
MRRLWRRVRQRVRRWDLWPHLRGIDTTKGQRSWRCDTHFTVVTTDSFTGVFKVVRTSARWHWLAIAKGYWSAWRITRAERATVTQRRALGWDV